MSRSPARGIPKFRRHAPALVAAPFVTASETGHAAHGTAQRCSPQISPEYHAAGRFIAGAIVAAETDGLATLPANLAKRLAAPLGLVAFETPISLPRIEITQYWHERYHRDAAPRWFRSVTSELFGTAATARGRNAASS